MQAPFELLVDVISSMLIMKSLNNQIRPVKLSAPSPPLAVLFPFVGS